MALGKGTRVKNCTAVKKAKSGEMVPFAFSFSSVMPDTFQITVGAIGESVRIAQQVQLRFSSSIRMPIETFRFAMSASRVELAHPSFRRGQQLGDVQ